MSKWIKYLGLLIPLAGAVSSLHILNVAVLPLLGGLVYGYFTERRRDVFLSPLAPLVSIAIVLSYYVAVDAARLIRYLSLFSTFTVLWMGLWLLFFVLGAAAGYLLRPSAQQIKK